MWDKSCVEPLLQSGDEVLQKKGDLIKRAEIKSQMNEKPFMLLLSCIH